MLNPVSDSLIRALRDALPARTFREAAPRYFEDPRGRLTGHAGLILAPATAEELGVIIAAAARHETPVIPRGGGTGLVGGQLATDGPPGILVSLERMAAIRAVYPEEGVIVAEAGATLAAVQAAAAEAGLLFPLSYGSEGTATIGGALSVNSGGLNVLRYGNARALCLGVEAVLPDGAVMHGLKRLRKDNTGYALRDLLIGAEGTLGLITAASLTLAPRPASVATALLAVPDPAAALRLLGHARRLAGGEVSAFELISATGPSFLVETGLRDSLPLTPFPDWAVLTEIGTSREDAETVMEHLFEEAHEAGDVLDGVLASSGAQRADLWSMREEIPSANRLVGAVASHDISLPLSQIPAFIAETAPLLTGIAPGLRINTFGHLGDGNLHYNLFPPSGQDKEVFEDRRARLTREVHDAVMDRGGSFSAEHGVGRIKTAEMARYSDPAALAAMRAIKRALDPKGIMNPGVILPD